MMEQFARNEGVVPDAVRRALTGRVIAVAGVGGAGGSIIEPLVRQHALGEVRLADFDEFSVTNLNRQVGSRLSTIGRAKVEVVAELLRDTNADLKVKTYPEGITLENVDAFLDGVDLLVDAVDFKAPAIHLALTRRARELGIPVILGAEIAYGARAVWFSPTGMSFEEYFGIDDKSVQISLRPLIMRLPPYVDLKAFARINKGGLEAPATATGAAALASLVIPMIEAILGGQPIAPAPVGRFTDTKALASGQVRHRRLAWYGALLRAVARNLLKRHQPALYPVE